MADYMKWVKNYISFPLKTILRPFADQIKKWVQSDTVIDHQVNMEHAAALPPDRLQFKTTIEPKFEKLFKFLFKRFFK